MTGEIRDIRGFFGHLPEVFVHVRLSYEFLPQILDAPDHRARWHLALQLTPTARLPVVHEGECIAGNLATEGLELS